MNELPQDFDIDQQSNEQHVYGPWERDYKHRFDDAPSGNMAIVAGTILLGVFIVGAMWFFSTYYPVR